MGRNTWLLVTSLYVTDSERPLQRTATIMHTFATLEGDPGHALARAVDRLNKFYGSSSSVSMGRLAGQRYTSRCCSVRGNHPRQRFTRRARFLSSARACTAA